MVDVVSPKVRSRMMAGIRGKNTRPELVIRSGLHRRGFRYRLHDPRMPGKPDIVLPKYKAVILIQGCFWHVHGCSLFKWPSSRIEFWRKKLQKNQERDRKNNQIYQENGWRVLIIWECAVKGRNKQATEELLDACQAWLIGRDGSSEIEGSNILGSAPRYFT